MRETEVEMGEKRELKWVDWKRLRGEFLRKIRRLVMGLEIIC